MALLDNLNWRYATKRMTGEKIPDENLQFILDATQLAASSYGLQPYTILVVSNPEVKAKLQAAAYGQAQLVESSHMLVFCAWENITEDDVSNYVADIANKRSLPVQALAGFQSYIWNAIKDLPQEKKQVWAAKQTYIALGTALAAAAEVKVDATPMEGFDAAQFDEILGLKEKGLKSAVIMALGYRSQEDQLANATKVRRDKEKLFQFID